MKKKTSLISQNDELHVAAVTKLLALTEIAGPGVASKATLLRGLLDQHADSEQRPLARIIQENLDTAGPFSLGIETLVEQATTASFWWHAS